MADKITFTELNLIPAGFVRMLSAEEFEVRDIATTDVVGINALIFSTADAAISARRNVEGGVVGIVDNFEIAMLNGGGGADPGTVQSILYHQNVDSNVKYRFAVRTTGEYAIADSETMLLKQDLADKNGFDGYPGLDGFKLLFGNVLDGSHLSYLTHSNTTQRTYEFPDRNITVAHAIGIDEVVGTTHALVTNTRYFCLNASLTTLTLPTTGSAVGDEILVAATGAGGWHIAQNASQSIRVGTLITTVGTGGSIASSAVGDCIHMVCTVANTTWQVISMIGGNLTII